jgi:hypothetical protein
MTGLLALTPRHPIFLAIGSSTRMLDSCYAKLHEVFFRVLISAARYLTVFCAMHSSTSECYDAYKLQHEGGRTMGINVGISYVIAIMHSIEMSFGTQY